MHPRQASLLVQVESLVEKTAAKGKSGAPVLWLYTCPETNKDFYLPEKKTTVKSPFTGKSFSAKPQKSSLSEVGKELKEDAAAEKAAK